MTVLRYLTRGFDKLGRAVAIALGFSLPISTAVDNLLLAVLLVCFVAGARFREKLSFIAGNPALIAPAAFFGLLAVGTLYGAEAPGENGHFLYKYLDLLLMPVMATFFRDPSTRRSGLHAFACAIVITLLLSFGIYASLMSRTPLLLHDETYAVPFKHSLTHSILVGFGAFVFVQFAVSARSRGARWAWLFLAALALANMTFLVPGRTGYVMLGALALYTGYSLWRWSGLVKMAVLSVLVLVVAYHASDRFHDRVALAFSEYSAEHPGVPTDARSAVAIRIEFYRNSLAIIRDHPIMGVGTGRFRLAYAEKVKDTGMTPTSNPHNEYLLIAIQIGVVGMLALLGVFGVQWRSARQLASPLETRLARGLVLAIGIGCLFNSLLIDHTEGLLYAWLTALLHAGRQPEGRQQAAAGSRQEAQARPEAAAPFTLSGKRLPPE